MSRLARNQGNNPMRNGFHLGQADRKLMGVCSGLAEYFNLDVTLVRVAWVLGTVLGFGSLILIYLAIGFIAD